MFHHDYLIKRCINVIKGNTCVLFLIRNFRNFIKDFTKLSSSSSYCHVFLSYDEVFLYPSLNGWNNFKGLNFGSAFNSRSASFFFWSKSGHRNYLYIHPKIIKLCMRLKKQTRPWPRETKVNNCTQQLQKTEVWAPRTLKITDVIRWSKSQFFCN